MELERISKSLLDTTDGFVREAIERTKQNYEIVFSPKTPSNERGRAGGQILTDFKTLILPALDTRKVHLASDALFPLEIVKDSRTYIVKIAEQAAGCYDLGYYDASAVMLRRLLETLIIECFEAHGISSNIKNSEGNLLFLEDLITKFLEQDGGKWNVGRNTKRALPNLKRVGDQSAHSRFFIAKKPDIDKMKDDVRTAIEELVHHSTKSK